MDNKVLPRLYVSYHIKDLDKVRHLSFELFDYTEVIDLQIGVGNRYYVEDYYHEAISTSSMVLVLVGNKWDNRQEREINTALTMCKTILLVLTQDNHGTRPEYLTKYNLPIVKWDWKELFNIISGNEDTINYVNSEKPSSIIRIDLVSISDELTNCLVTHPDLIYELTPRKFEELIAYIMGKHGYDVTLTQQSHDGGIDIFAVKKDGFGHFLTLVDCKKYSKNCPVGVDLVRTMYGTLNIEKASHGIIATTSRFTNDAHVLAEKYSYQISLKDHADIIGWMKN